GRFLARDRRTQCRNSVRLMTEGNLARRVEDRNILLAGATLLSLSGAAHAASLTAINVRDYNGHTWRVGVGDHIIFNAGRLYEGYIYEVNLTQFLRVQLLDGTIMPIPSTIAGWQVDWTKRHDASLNHQADVTMDVIDRAAKARAEGGEVK